MHNRVIWVDPIMNKILNFDFSLERLFVYCKVMVMMMQALIPYTMIIVMG